MAEVPISYSFRDNGTSFVRLGRYLRKVVPAVHRELNADRMSAHTRCGTPLDAADGVAVRPAELPMSD